MGALEILVISSAVLAFLIVVILLSAYGKKLDNKDRRVDYIVNDGSENKNPNELTGTFYSRLLAPIMAKFNRSFSNLAKKKNNDINAKESRSVQEMKRSLRLAGINMDPHEYTMRQMFQRVIFTFLSIIVACILPASLEIKFAVAMLGMAVSFAAPTFILRAKSNGRQNAIRNQLPDVMDLIGICVEAGLSFDAALERISQDLEGPCVDEFMVLYREIQMGKSRRDALNDMANASNVDELKTFTSALAQADALGIPLKNVLSVQSKQLRMERSQSAKEKGMKASIKMLLPMIMFIFPALFIILMSPTVVNIMEQLSM